MLQTTPVNLSSNDVSLSTGFELKSNQAIIKSLLLFVSLQKAHHRSASRRLLVVPRIQLDTYGRRAFAVVGPTVWNALGNDLHDPDLSIASFGRLLKTHLFQQYSVHRAH